MNTKDTWYVASMGSDPFNQGLVASEKTGENIAVTYKAENAPIIAAAPELLKALQDLEGMCNMPEVRQAMMKHNQAYYHGTMRAAREAIRKAEGER